jgi:dolichyl-diphosphooligosaccharide--protein glycosyltransferase
MSQQQSSSERSDRSPFDLLERWYRAPALLGVLAVMFWTLLQLYGNFVRNRQVHFRGDDPWYHVCETSYLLENYPSTTRSTSSPDFRVDTAPDSSVLSGITSSRSARGS